MGAGTPDYQRLHQLGKLPAEARKFVPTLAENDEAKKEIEDLKIKNQSLVKYVKAFREILKNHKIEYKEELTKLVGE